MTAAQILEDVKNQFDQQGSSGAFTDAELLSLLNEGYRDLMRFTQMREKSQTTTVSATESLLSIPSDFIEARQTRWSYNRQLIPLSERRLDYDAKGWWFRSSDTPSNVIYNNWNQMRLYPIPSAAGTVNFRYSFLPADMTSTDSPQMPIPFQSILTDYVVAQCFLIVRETEAGLAAWTKYLEGRLNAADRARQENRTPDTLVSQRPTTVFNYPLWDTYFRSV